MIGKSFRNIRRWKAVKISQSIFYILLGLTAALFALFFLVGYENPYEENPDFNAPYFTGAVIWFMIAMVIGAVAVTIAFTAYNLHKGGGSKKTVNGIKTSAITLAVSILTIALLALTFILAPTERMTINGEEYTDKLWLRATEMFVDTSALLLIAALITVGIGYIKHFTRRK